MGLGVPGKLDHLVTFIRACQFYRLATLHLYVTHPPRSGRPVESFASIFQYCDPALLTSFSVTFSPDVAQAQHCPNRLMDYFEPLLAFPNISSFRVDAFIESELSKPPVHDDDDFARMGAAWPRLADLSVLYYHLIGTYSPSPGQHTQGGVSVTRPTLAGVIELARRCPELVTLKICELDLDAGTVPVPELEGAEDPPDAVPRLGGWHGLRSFVASNVLQPCAVQKYAEAAAVLDRVFRALDVEHSQRLMGWASGGKDWKEILCLLGTIRLGRGSEKSGQNAGPPPASMMK